MSYNLNLLIIKLGGSVITFKEKPLTPNFDAIDKIVMSIKEIKKNFKIILVHGGGSFGHYWSIKYDMHTKPSRYSDEGISIVHESMLKLNDMILERFIYKGLKPYSISPSSIIFNNLPCRDRIIDIIDMMHDNELIPITYGDVVHIKNGNYSILSGDTLMSILSNVLKPQSSIFLTNVDGLFSNSENGILLKEIFLKKINNDVIIQSGNNDNNKVEFSVKPSDVTGGMKRKISESWNIVNSGTTVYLMNGLVPERLMNLVSGHNFFGTVVKKGY